MRPEYTLAYIAARCIDEATSGINRVTSAYRAYKKYAAQDFCDQPSEEYTAEKIYLVQRDAPTLDRAYTVEELQKRLKNRDDN